MTELCKDKRFRVLWLLIINIAAHSTMKPIRGKTCTCPPLNTGWNARYGSVPRPNHVKTAAANLRMLLIGFSPLKASSMLNMIHAVIVKPIMGRRWISPPSNAGPNASAPKMTSAAIPINAPARIVAIFPSVVKCVK